ncbi:MAG: tRNA (adenosine(37)-N6)-threonylcarbamoyltransferase complex ATPase subunit type 1 TsaE [Paludibacter sp.]|nr:tRNA (adenosine(37)-N6)-threonylcarbamoyltransferase complex ATPase subunit type 1 TsaE [Paludibacter sp.]
MRDKLNLFEKYKIICVNGEMGVGKTTFIKSVCEMLSVEDEINSPTFSIVNEYETQMGEKIFHFDCYRLNSIDEAYNIGFEDYLLSGNICFIEWMEVIKPLLPQHYLNIDIEETNMNHRKLKIYES